MPLPNSANAGKGRQFQMHAARALAQHFGTPFRTEYSILIGHPAKAHKFDLASEDGRYVGESKNYSWTEAGNIPSAKMGFLNEAVFYLQHVAPEKRRFVVLRRDVRASTGESLAEYYYRINQHLLNGVFIIEIDVETKEVRTFGESNTFR